RVARRFSLPARAVLGKHRCCAASIQPARCFSIARLATYRSRTYRSLQSRSTTGRPPATSLVVSAGPIHRSRRSAAIHKPITTRSGGPLENLDQYDLIFVDSITHTSRLCFRWAEQQPEARSERTGAKDLRGAYGLNARELLLWLYQLQHLR